MKTKEIKINDKSVKVRSATISEMLSLLDLIKQFPEKLKDLDPSDEASTLRVFSVLIKENSEEVFKVLSVLTGVRYDLIKNMTLAEGMRLIRAFLEVNDIAEIKKEWGELVKAFQEQGLQSSESK